MLRKFFIATLLPILGGAAPAQSPSPPSAQVAAVAYRELSTLCDGDNGNLWGVKICGPTMFVDPSTRRLVANADGLDVPLSRDGDIFRGNLPTTIGLANTSVHWNGRDWAMILWPLPTDRVSRAILLIHENWHRIQSELGLPATSWDEDHLATVDGRIGMRLELRALAAALRARGAAREKAVRDALFFRQWRRAQFKEASAHENGLELNEGMAEYTGRRLSNDPAMIEDMALRLDAGDHVEAFARSFAYYTGPAYGILLDDYRPGWRSDLKRARDLGKLLDEKIPTVGPHGDVRKIGARGEIYGYRSIRHEEARTGRLRSREDAHWRALLVDGPVVLVPVMGANITFDPRRVKPLPPYGAIYLTMTASGVWGRLSVTQGALLNRGWSKIALPRDGSDAGPTELRGIGWELQLSPGWTWRRGPRSNDVSIVCANGSLPCKPGAG